MGKTIIRKKYINPSKIWSNCETVKIMIKGGVCARNCSQTTKEQANTISENKIK